MSATITNITTNPETGMTTFTYNNNQYTMPSALDSDDNSTNNAPSITDMQAYAQQMDAAKALARINPTGGKRSRRSRKSKKSRKTKKSKKSKKSKKARKARR
jgi:hypothetical protein